MFWYIYAYLILTGVAIYIGYEERISDKDFNIMLVLSIFFGWLITPIVLIGSVIDFFASNVKK